MQSDIEIAEAAALRPIAEIAEQLDLRPADLETYGEFKAKLRIAPPPDDACRGKLILVTAMTATRKGAGKTVTSIGLGQAMGRLGLRHCVCLREPSLGPTLGLKGGAAGGGLSQVLPMEDINLHFTGDIHAVGAAHNLLAALTDNHVHFDNPLNLDEDRLLFPRVLDLCDRQLRGCRIGLGGGTNGFEHNAHFDITAASEVMAVLALSRDSDELRQRLARIVVANDRHGAAITAEQMQAVGAMLVLLKQAALPNLVQTVEHTPALVHCGPFANIAHGCSSVAATRAALSLADYVVTEAGFGADLGAEKFLHIKCRQAGLWPAVAVVVLTSASLRRHGGVPERDSGRSNPQALIGGLENARVHIENMGKLGIRVVVALNHFPGDSPAEVDAIRALCDQLEVPFVVSLAHARGGAGALELAHEVKQLADKPPTAPRFLYEPGDSFEQKLDVIAREIYRADGVDFDDNARRDIEHLRTQGYGQLPPCVAKTPHSLSDRASQIGVPSHHRLRVGRVELAAGAGFLVAHAGKVTRMPGMPRSPGAHRLHVDAAGRTRGLS